MKIPAAKQLPSGAWFCRVRVNGADYPITRETEKAAIAEAMAVKAGVKAAAKGPKRITLEKACTSYIKAKSGVLSPSTIRGYDTIKKTRFQCLMDTDITKISAQKWQTAISIEAHTISAKTVKNAFGFISSVLTYHGIEAPSVRLPQIIREDRPFLAPEQIPIFLNAVNGKRVELAALLGLHGLRRSEIKDIKWNDIDAGKKVIHVHGAAVLDSDGKLVHKKENKTSGSRRDVPILIDRILEIPAGDADAYAVDMNTSSIYGCVNSACEKAGLPPIGVHGLRHSFASLLYSRGVSELTAMRLGGWSDFGTMRKIYTHLAESDLAAQVENVRSFFQNDNKNANADKKV